MVVHFPHEYKTQPSGFLLNDDRLKGFVEGYAYALQDIMFHLTGDNSCGKQYDPMLVRDMMYSYAFDMKDGGRHHPISDYKDIGEITETLLTEALDWIKED